MKKIALQGIQGSFHEIAARAYFKEEIEIIECKSFKEVFEVMKKDSSVIGEIAIENTIAGSLLGNHELIKNHEQTIVGEHKLRIKHNLCLLPGQKVTDIKEVWSHPIALMQCRDFLSPKNWHLVETGDTASSAKEINEKELKGIAAICSSLAAKNNNLEILAKGIETNKRNFTRFLFLADRWQAEEIQKNQEINKSSLVFAVPHKAGALSKVLSIFSFYDINLTKLQSLPIIGREWEYMFYICLEFDNYMRYKQAVNAILPLTKDFKILGEYEKGTQTI